MDVYIFQAALWCGECIKPALVDLEHDEDSNKYPQGPHANGGGEADCPQHCDGCNVFLENPLTRDGVEYVREQLAEHADAGKVLDTWREFYKDELGG